MIPLVFFNNIEDRQAGNNFLRAHSNIQNLAELISQLSIGKVPKKVTAVCVLQYFLFVMEADTTNQLLNVKPCFVQELRTDL
jgi:hypothetical protein